MEMANSCKDCTERHIGCHAKCESYNREVEWHRMVNGARRLEQFKNERTVLRNIKSKENADKISRRRQGY